MAKIGITETVLRDAHQSLIATRMRTDEFEGILEKMDKIGYHSLECWGGATFDACLRFLDEDPWDRLRLIRKKCPNTKLQMLFRGQNMLGYRHYSDELVDYFVKKSIDNGIDILRIFDALNDVRNLQTAINAAKKYGGHVQAAISYTTGPVFDTEYYCHYAKELEDAGADSICIKRSVRCTCLSDGEMTRWNRDEFVGVLDEKFLPDWAKESLSQFQQEEAAESPGMNNQSM